MSNNQDNTKGITLTKKQLLIIAGVLLLAISAIVFITFKLSSGRVQPQQSPATTTVAPALISPKASVESGSYEGPLTVELTGEGQIYYTLDGSEPGDGSILYDSPITLDASCLLKIVAYGPNGQKSDVLSYDYVIEAKEMAAETVNDLDLINKASVFLSNFTEINMPSFEVNSMSNRAMIDYALNHLYLNSIYSDVYEDSYTVGTTTVEGLPREVLAFDGARVGKIVARDLNKDLAKNESTDLAKFVDGKYEMLVGAERGSYACAKVESLKKREDGLYVMEAYEYIGYKSFFTSKLLKLPLDELKHTFDDFARIAKIKALASYDGKRFKVLEYVNTPVERVVLSERRPVDNRLVDSVTGNGISNVSMVFKGGSGALANGTVFETSTDGNGHYDLSGLAAGNYVLVLDAPGYIQSSINVYFDGVSILGYEAIPMSTVLRGNQMRIVLAWGENPTDLDSHLAIGNQDYIYFSKQISDNGKCNLDIDDTNSYGPETITINDFRDGDFEFYVHDFVNKEDPASTALLNSGATVTVYVGDKMVASFKPKAGVGGAGGTGATGGTGAGTFWHVFSLRGGQVVPVESILGYPYYY